MPRLLRPKRRSMSPFLSRQMTSLRRLMSKNSLAPTPWIEVVTSSTNAEVRTTRAPGRAREDIIISSHWGKKWSFVGPVSPFHNYLPRRSSEVRDWSSSMREDSTLSASSKKCQPFPFCWTPLSSKPFLDLKSRLTRLLMRSLSLSCPRPSTEWEQP